jgi:hypothetical protein
MADGRANIDLVFRNGLKDYEVLPPLDVWENIHPAIGKKRSYFPFLKAAAAVAVIVSMSFLAYRWGMEVSENRLNEMRAANQQPVIPAIYPAQSVSASGVINNRKEVSARGRQVAVETLNVEEHGSVAQNLPENTGINVTRRILEDREAMPGIQDPFATKYAKVTSPELEAVTYQVLQDNIEIPVMQRWSVSAIASPTYYSQISSSGNDLAKQVMESDQARASYTGGLALSYKISKRFSIQSGLYYSSMGQEVGGVNAYSGFQQYDNSKGDHNFELTTASGTVYTKNSDVFLNSYSVPERVQTYYNNDVFDPVKANLSYVSSTIYQDLSFLELPVLVRYKVIDRKMGVNLIGGVSYNFLVNNSVYAIMDGGRYPVGTTEGLNPMSLSSSVGMGMEYRLSQNFSFSLEPTFRYYLNTFNSGRESGIHPYSLGIFSGVAYKF